MSYLYGFGGLLDNIKSSAQQAGTALVSGAQQAATAAQQGANSPVGQQLISTVSNQIMGTFNSSAAQIDKISPEPMRVGYAVTVTGKFPAAVKVIFVSEAGAMVEAVASVLNANTMVVTVPNVLGKADMRVTSGGNVVASRSVEIMPAVTNSGVAMPMTQGGPNVALYVGGAIAAGLVFWAVAKK